MRESLRTPEAPQEVHGRQVTALGQNEMTVQLVELAEVAQRVGLPADVPAAFVLSSAVSKCAIAESLSQRSRPLSGIALTRQDRLTRRTTFRVPEFAMARISGCQITGS